MRETLCRWGWLLALLAGIAAFVWLPPGELTTRWVLGLQALSVGLLLLVALRRTRTTPRD